MGRRAKSTEDEFFDIFASWTADDQEAALKVMNALHRQSLRTKPKVSPQAPGKEDPPMRTV